MIQEFEFQQLQRDMNALKADMAGLREELVKLNGMLSAIRSETSRTFKTRVREFFIFCVAYVDGYLHHHFRWRPTRECEFIESQDEEIKTYEQQKDGHEYCDKVPWVTTERL